MSSPSVESVHAQLADITWRLARAEAALDLRVAARKRARSSLPPRPLPSSPLSEAALTSPLRTRDRPEKPSAAPRALATRGLFAEAACGERLDEARDLRAYRDELVSLESFDASPEKGADGGDVAENALLNLEWQTKRAAGACEGDGLNEQSMSENAVARCLLLR